MQDVVAEFMGLGEANAALGAKLIVVEEHPPMAIIVGEQSALERRDRGCFHFGDQVSPLKQSGCFQRER